MRVPVLAALLVFAAPMPIAEAAARVRVVAAENFYGDVAHQIGGTHVDAVSVLSNPDQDPHLFESSPSTARALAAADIVIYNGAGYDPWMEKLLSASTKAGRAAIDVANLVGAKEGDNPHLWYEPGVLTKLAAALTAQLSARDPADAAEFKANLTAFETSFRPIDRNIAAIRDKYQGLEVTATEPVFGYMAKALGFKMLNEGFQTAVMNNAEPSASQVADFEASLKSGKVRLLFFNSQVTDTTTQRLKRIAAATGIPVIGVTETEPADTDVQNWFAGQVGKVREALAAKAR